jgi:hypothetical protein
LWESAVEAAGAHGVHRTAKALRVNYYTLKKRVALAASGADLPPESPPDAADRPAVSANGQALAAFLELTPPASSSVCECIVELENPAGDKMRVHLKGAEVPDLAALSRCFWSAEA